MPFEYLNSSYLIPSFRLSDINILITKASFLHFYSISIYKIYYRTCQSQLSFIKLLHAFGNVSHINIIWVKRQFLSYVHHMWKIDSNSLSRNSTIWFWKTMYMVMFAVSTSGLRSVGPKTMATFCTVILFSSPCWITLKYKNIL